MFERFTEEARQVLVLAQEEARLLNHGFIGTEHLLLGVIHEGHNLGSRTLFDAGVTLDAARRLVGDTIGLGGDAPIGSPPFTPRAKKVLELSLRESIQLGHWHIGPEHLLLGLIREGEGVGAQVIERLVGLQAVRLEILGQIEGQPGSEFREAPIAAGISTSGPPQVLAGQWSRRLVACSFCRREAPATGRLVSGRANRGEGAYICEHCIKWWAEALGDAGDESRQPPGEPER